MQKGQLKHTFAAHTLGYSTGSAAAMAVSKTFPPAAHWLASHAQGAMPALHAVSTNSLTMIFALAASAGVGLAAYALQRNAVTSFLNNVSGNKAGPKV